MAQNDNDIAQAFLLNPKFRIYRHLLLIIVVIFISATFIWDIFTEFSYKDIFIGLGAFTLIFLAAIYCNIYVLTPLLLLKNRLFYYFTSLVVLVLVSIASFIVIQNILFQVKEPTGNPDITFVIITIASSVLASIFLLAGTSTILLFKQWIIYTRRINELESNTLQTELKLLKNQINPHFLFNMLNNANIMSEEDPEMASHILFKLNEMLDYQINDSAKDKVYLSEDIAFITSFLDMEKTRRDHFDYTISQNGSMDNIEIPPLLFISFVENAVKHNLDNSKSSYVHITFKIDEGKLIFICENSKPKVPVVRKAGGLGLTNIRRRLDLLYGNEYLLELLETETTYTVNLELKI